MPNFRDDVKSGAQWIQDGEHPVKVVQVKLERRNEKPAIEVLMANKDGHLCKETFWLTEAALWRLKKFAIACGITNDQLGQWTYAITNGEVRINETCLTMLKDRRIIVRVGRENDDDKYAQVLDFWATTQEASDGTDLPF